MTENTDLILLKLGEMKGEVSERLGRIEEKLTDIPDHEKRIRRLERAFWTFVGAATAWSWFVGYHIKL